MSVEKDANLSVDFSVRVHLSLADKQAFSPVRAPVGLSSTPLSQPVARERCFDLVEG